MLQSTLRQVAHDTRKGHNGAAGVLGAGEIIDLRTQIESRLLNRNMHLATCHRGKECHF